ncbi:MAG: DUF1552 domain-containing protein [Myxococcales bacterium]|nr:MAG: DUF1552 domain-containing protein [Myxococcales bacterium]
MSKLTRRSWLAGLGALAALPVMRGFRPAYADPPPPVRRLVQFFTPHGTLRDRWLPTMGPDGLALAGILEPLAPLRKKIVVLDGLGFQGAEASVGAPHTKGPAHLWTNSPLADDGTFDRPDCSGGCSFGWNTGPSVDQVIIDKIKPQTDVESLQLGVYSYGGFPGSDLIYKGPAQPLDARSDPLEVYNQIFAPRQPTDEAKALRAERLDALEGVAAELASIKPRVSGADWKRLEAHLDGVNDLQKSLQEGAAKCELASPGKGPAKEDAEHIPWRLDRQIEMTAMALGCGITNFVSLQHRVGENDGGPDGTYRWLGQQEEHHLTTHSSDQASLDRLFAIYRWYAEKFAKLVQALDSIPDGTGTLLDSTLVVWGSEIGRGQDHDMDNIPFVVAGGGAGGVKGNRLLQFPDGTGHGRLLVSMQHFFGLTDVKTFGSLDQGAGPLVGLVG